MIEDKIIETSVDLLEPVDIYTVDLPKLLLDKLIKRYKGVCYSSMLITDVLEIIRYSDRYLVDNRLDGGCYVNVQCKVRGIILCKGEILHGCKVIKITNSNIIIDHKYVTGMMLADPKRRVIVLVRKDQLIPVIVNDVRYNIGKPQISIICIPYIPMPIKQIFYNINDNLSPEDTEKVDDLLTRITDELTIHNNIKNTKSYAFFRDVMYPYKTQQKFNMSPIGSKFNAVNLDIKSLLAIKDGCILLPDLSTDIQHSKNKLDTPNVQIIDSSYYPAISELLINKLNYLIALRGFAEQYDTPEKVENMLAYWKTCMSLKE